MFEGKDVQECHGWPLGTISLCLNLNFLKHQEDCLGEEPFVTNDCSYLLQTFLSLMKKIPYNIPKVWNIAPTVHVPMKPHFSFMEPAIAAKVYNQ